MDRQSPLPASEALTGRPLRLVPARSAGDLTDFLNQRDSDYSTLVFVHSKTRQFSRLISPNSVAALMSPCVLRTWRLSPKMKEAIMVKQTRVRFVAAFFLSVGLIGASSIAQAQSGIASVYSGGRTASGETARASGMTAAHRTLPIGTLVRVTNRRSGRTAVVRINDRGPFVRGRIIDVTPAAARMLGFSGLAPVTLDVIGRRG